MQRFAREHKAIYRLQSNISVEAGRQLAAVCNDAGMSKRSAIEYAIGVAFVAATRGLAPEELRDMVNGLPVPMSVDAEAVGDSPTLNPSPTED